MTAPQPPLFAKTRFFPPIGASRVTPLRALGRLLLVWQARATNRSHLASLGDRALRDMGMTRADATREAAKPFWRA